MILRWTSCFGGWDSDMVSQSSLLKTLSPQFLQNFPPLMFQVFIGGLLHILQEIDAGRPYTDVPVEFFREKPLVLQYPGPEVNGDVRFNRHPAQFKNSIRTLFRC